MSISIYSVLTSFLWFNLFVLVLCVLRWKLKIILGYNLYPLFVLTVVSTVRLLLPFEPSFATVLRSERVLPFLQEVLRKKIIIGSMNIPLWVMIVLILSLVSAILLIRLLSSVRQELLKMRAYQQTDHARVLSIFQKVVSDSASKRTCQRCLSKNCSSPYIFGLISSTIVLPEESLSLSDQDLFYILKHEWQHHLGKDVAVKLFIEALCCIMWWNPLIYLLRHNLNQTLELKCDVGVVRNLSPEQRIHYAEALLHVLTVCTKNEVSSSRDNLASIAFSGTAYIGKKSSKEGVLQRFDVVLSSNDSRKRISAASVFCLLFLFLASFCIVVQPYSLPSEKELAPDGMLPADIGVVEITPETAILVDNQDGTYKLLVNEVHFHTVDSDAISHEPYNLLPVIEPDQEKEVNQ